MQRHDAMACEPGPKPDLALQAQVRSTPDRPLFVNRHDRIALPPVDGAHREFVEASPRPPLELV